MATTDFGVLSAKTVERWAALIEEDDRKAEKVTRLFLRGRQQALDTQAERYEAAINPAYEPDPEPEPRTIKFKRPIPFEANP